MRRFWLAAPFALLLIAAAPVEPAPFARQLANAATLLDAGKTDEALALLDPMLAAAETPGDRGQIEALRSFALARLNRIPEARQAIEIGVASIPAPSLLVLRQLFLLRAFDGDPRGAAETLELIAASDPRGLAQIPSEVVFNVRRGIAKDETRAFNLDYALVTAGWQPADAAIGDTDWLRLKLVTGLAARDRIEDAGPIVEQILSPVVLIHLGIDKRFAPLWPLIEARLGPAADTADAAYVAATKARFDKAPDSLVARLGYASALNIASREAEAITIADVAKTPAELAALSERELGLVDLHATLLGDTGRIDEALARFAALNASPIEGHPGLINTIIDQALFAVSVGRPKAALAAADFADTKAGFANDYGKLYIAQARACALAQLGRADDAAAAAAALLAAPATNDAAYLDAMICLGKLDAAAAAIVRRLGNPETRATMLFALQPFLIADHPKLRGADERAALRTLKGRADVKAAFLKAGRDLPAAVAPPR